MLTATLKGTEKLDSLFRSLPDRVLAGTKVTGAATAYALVWEFGSARIKKPGPKTLQSVTADGTPAILSLQAPHGYIRIHRYTYLEIMREEWAKTKLKGQPTLSAITGFINRVAGRSTELIKSTAPVDSGDLRDGIVVAEVGDQAWREQV